MSSTVGSIQQHFLADAGNEDVAAITWLHLIHTKVRLGTQ